MLISSMHRRSESCHVGMVKPKILSSLVSASCEFIGRFAGVGYSDVGMAFMLFIASGRFKLSLASFAISSVKPCQLV